MKALLLKICFILFVPLVAISETGQSGSWKGDTFDMGKNQICAGELRIEKGHDTTTICFKFDCQKNGGGKTIEKWLVKRTKNELFRDGKRVGFVKGERLLLEENYPLNNDYAFEFKDDYSKVDLLTDAAIGDFKGTLVATKEKNICMD